MGDNSWLEEVVNSESMLCPSSPLCSLLDSLTSSLLSRIDHGALLTRFVKLANDDVAANLPTQPLPSVDRKLVGERQAAGSLDCLYRYLKIGESLVSWDRSIRQNEGSQGDTADGAVWCFFTKDDLVEVCGYSNIRWTADDFIRHFPLSIPFVFLWQV